VSHEFLHCPLSLPQPSPGGQRRIKAGTEGVTWHTLRHEAPWQTTRHHHVAPTFPAAQASRRILSSRCAGSLHSGAVAAKAGIGDPVPARLHDFDEPGFELRGLREAKVRQIDCFAGRLDCQAAAAFAAYPNWWPASTSSFSITTLTAAPSPRPLLHSILENLARLCSCISGAQRQPGCGPPCELEAHSDRGPRQRRKRSIPANASHVQ
jgi:hypothetical protein